MRSLLAWGLALFATWVVVVTLACLALRWRLQRANRVSRAVRTPAPTTWLWLPTRSAQLHRRLRLATREIQLAPSRRHRPATRLSVEDLRRELELQAVELDHHVVAAARHPRPQRRALLRQLDTQVAEVERLSVRLARLSRPTGLPATGWDHAGPLEPPAPPQVLGELSLQLDLLDQARAEVDQIERSAGLGGVDAALAPISPPRRPEAPPRP